MRERSEYLRMFRSFFGVIEDNNKYTWHFISFLYYSKYDMVFCASFLLFRDLPALFHSYSCASLCMMRICGNDVRVGLCIYKHCRRLRKRTELKIEVLFS